MYKIFETHAHYDDEAFDEDREELMNSLKKAGVERVVNIGASMQSCVDTVGLMEKYPFVYGAIGVHPSEVWELDKFAGGDEAAIKWLKDMAVLEKSVAIGEIGLDYHYEDTDKAVQKKWFIRQLELARELGLPVVIHSRDAAKDTVDFMNEMNAGDIGGVVHCYSYSKELAKTFLDMGYMLGIGGVITFSNAKKLVEVVEYAPLDSIVLETDSPYLAPMPYRGKRNSSLNIPLIAEKISEIKNVSVEEVYDRTWNNAMRLYRM